MHYSKVLTFVLILFCTSSVHRSSYVESSQQPQGYMLNDDDVVLIE